MRWRLGTHRDRTGTWYHYESTNGLISEGNLFSAEPFEDGYGKVKFEENGVDYYMDLAGNYSVLPTTAIGDDLYKFNIGLIKLNDLNLEYFTNDKFVNAVRAIVEEKSQEKLKEFITRKDIDKNFNILEDIKKTKQKLDNMIYYGRRLSSYNTDIDNCDN